VQSLGLQNRKAAERTGSLTVEVDGKRIVVDDAKW
jgi:hypothetical protein